MTLQIETFTNEYISERFKEARLPTPKYRLDAVRQPCQQDIFNYKTTIGIKRNLAHPVDECVMVILLYIDEGKRGWVGLSKDNIQEALSPWLERVFPELKEPTV